MSAILAMISWWIEGGFVLSADEMYALLLDLVVPGVERVTGGPVPGLSEAMPGRS